MTLAIIQPYLFPYIGYFQLIHAADKMLWFDDVNYIKRGWVNRNRILVNGKEFLFTVPIDNASSLRLMKDTAIDQTRYDLWKKKYFETLRLAYSKAPFYKQCIDMITGVFNESPASICELSISSLVRTSEYLELNVLNDRTSRLYQDVQLKGQDRILQICKDEKATHYVNPIGGTELYSKSVFSENGINLSFIKTKEITYPQFNQHEHVPFLSIIDVMMFNSVEKIKNFLVSYELV
jgi:hypothetical protein